MDIFQSKLSDSDKDSEDLGKIAVLEDHAVRCWQQMNLHAPIVILLVVLGCGIFGTGMFELSLFLSSQSGQEGILKSLVEGHGPETQVACSSCSRNSLWLQL